MLYLGHKCNSYGKEKRNSFKKKIDREAVSDVYDLLQGYTYYLQRTLNECFSAIPSGAVCDRGFAFMIIDNILDSGEHTYRDILSGITANQRALLSAIAKEGLSSNITSFNFVNKYGLGAVSSVQSSARALLKRQFISRNPDKQYYLDDKFLELWLIRQFGITPEIRLQQNRL